MGSACTPSMNAEQTQEPMMTGRSCTKEAGRLSEPSLLMLSGKRSMRNGPRGHQRSFPSGLVRGQARKLVMLRLLRVKKRGKRKKRKSKSYALDKSTFDLPKHLWIFIFLRKDFILSAPVLRILQSSLHRKEDHQHIPDVSSL